jgi:hypothetical protein
MQYKDFVKQQMTQMKSSKMSQPEKMKKISQMWKEHKTKGGVLDDKETKKQTMDEKQEEEPDTMSKGLNLPEPFIDYNTMVNNGLPPYLAQHPNIYSGNLNNVLLFNNVEEFLDSSFYKKYKDRIVFKKAVKSFGGGDTEYNVPAKKFRIVFHANSFTDKSVWYIDPKDADEWLQIMNDSKDSHILIPVEFVSALNLKKSRDALLKATQDSIETYNKAFDKGNEEGFHTGYGEGHEAGFQEGYQKGKSDSSDNWFTSALDTGLSVAKVLI